MKKRPGITILELLVSVAIGGAVAAGVTATAVREVDGRNTRQDELHIQQALASTLRTFSEDVRAGAGITIAQDTYFRMRQYHKDGTFDYVSYRIANGRLQRGEAATATAEPTAWSDFFDGNRFTLTAGRFTYFQANNVAGGTTSTMRRVAITDLDLRARRTNTPVPIPAITAVMRESSTARELMPACEPEVTDLSTGGQCHWSGNDIAVVVCAVNKSTRAITTDAFSGNWATTCSNPLTRVSLVKADNTKVTLWQASCQSASKTILPFNQLLPFAAGETKRLELKFDNISAKIDTVALKIYEKQDTARKTPLLITAKLDD